MDSGGSVTKMGHLQHRQTAAQDLGSPNTCCSRVLGLGVPRGSCEERQIAYIAQLVWLPSRGRLPHGPQSWDPAILPESPEA